MTDRLLSGFSMMIGRAVKWAGLHNKWPIAEQRSAHHSECVQCSFTVCPNITDIIHLVI